MYSHKSPATIFGLVSVCLLLVFLTLFFVEALAIGVFTVLVSPFAIVGTIVFLSVRLLLLILSPICVLPYPFFKKATKCEYCRLCRKCWILARSVEKHAFYNQSELKESTYGCHLCQLLFASVDAFKEQEDITDPNNSQPTQDKCRDSENEAVVRGCDRPNNSKSSTVRIWMKVPFWDSPVLRLQLCGASVAKSKPIEIHWTAKGNSTMPSCMCVLTDPKDDIRHRCYDSLYTDSSDIFKWAN
jgi:hypothetical protein